MRCIINGDHFTFEKSLNIQELIREIGLDEQRVIVEHNEELISQKQFPTQIVNDKDCLELLEFVGGG
ncbi:thiamine biosynthesis protein ThiS [Staphylococcus casei]|uniref:Sulfur carrier protein ThiS n=1 Tax=Staphylococcus casei TaxID=201828 RepID=A0ABZ2W852_9STAP|nr:sulfur carrier protein ThiS [Staphylococcus casei]OEL03272.1 thiamine biosynthesis protein ThiS [Staphylococcus succinus]PNZ56639.1 thiamine biosynthesis protein ThiS [Staphylococcus casei]PTI42684.1 thiamine biosynthesis protein ThiS [Staphylococcus succinus]PTI80525.1 thiamine biosynthesis protein ThiS [Staphylococcus succinus]WJE86534.1 sulfur carrier protein ThiS [Staphylococcus casei]